MEHDDARHVQEHYARGLERYRLDRPLGTVAFERSREIIARHLPPPPCVVADIGGGPGRYALWLAESGYGSSIATSARSMWTS